MQTELGPGIRVDGMAVRRLRLLHRHLGVAALAEELGISRDYLYKIESGQRPSVSPAMFRRLKEALNVETDVLLPASHK